MKGFKLIGKKLSGKTTNENGRSQKDCGRLWQDFENNKIAVLIPGKLDNSVYAVYFDYEGHENDSFSYFIGLKVDESVSLPKGLDELFIPEQNYQKITARGKMTGCITEAWEKIWESGRKRKFGFDFEVYDERSRDWNNAEVDIYLSVED